MEGSPRHVVSEHFEVDELEQSYCLEIRIGSLDFVAAFSQAILNILSLAPLVIA